MSFDPAGSGRILDAALQQFAERGYENTTLEAVGAAASADRPSVELLFPTKATLFSVLLNRELDRVRTQVIDAVPTEAGGLSVGQAVGRALDVLVAHIRTNPASWRLLLQSDFGSFGERHAREELRDVLRTRLRWLVASASNLDAADGRSVSELLSAMLAAMVEVSIDPLLAGDSVVRSDTVEDALDRLFATG
jgi:AcrR family transcriptional regulator